MRLAVRRAAYAFLALCSVAMFLLAIAWVTDFDFRFEGDQERAIREFASSHRATDLRFPGADHQPIRPPNANARSFDLSSSALSFVEQEIDAALVNDPANSRLLFLRSQIHLLHLQPTEAIGILERLRPFAPKDPDLLGSLGYAHYLRGRADNEMREILRAIDFFEKALEADPHNSVLLFNAAVAYQRVNRREAAEKLFQQLLALEGSDGWTMEAKARLLEITLRKE